MPEENNTGDPLLDASQLNAAGGEPTVGSVPTSEFTLDELNRHLGKTFPSKEVALKALTDTFSYVGKKKEDIEREVKLDIGNDARFDQLAKELAVERVERFYDKNPQYADPSIRKFIESTGKSPVEVVNMQEFKDIYQKISGYDESQKLKTVLESNPRLASSKDSLTKARELQANSGSKEEVENLATRAVLDAYGL